MSEAISTARWRDHPLVPADYEDVPALVRLAHIARGQVVEFDWAFGRDDLQGLRRAVFEWGSPVRGRYKRFDARMLAAMNVALGETDTVLVLSEPAGSVGPDCAVECLRDGDGFRLRGSVTFDIALGWGVTGVQESGPGRAFLGSAVRATLADSVAMLGWDLRRLQDKSFDPVWNALYGLPLSYGAGKAPLPPEPELPVDLKFQGPFSAVDDGECRCLFTDPIATKNGIYLWTIEVDGAALPWYVGQTRRGFAQRMSEHIVQMLAGRYAPHDPVALSRGDSTRLCEGVGAQNGGAPLQNARLRSIAVTGFSVILFDVCRGPESVGLRVSPEFSTRDEAIRPKLVTQPHAKGGDKLGDCFEVVAADDFARRMHVAHRYSD
jgi:hypothetical protein